MKITVIYLLCGILWLLFAEVIVLSLMLNTQATRIAEFIKGTVFIMITSSIIYILLKRYISDKQQADRALYESEKRLRTLINSIPDHVVLKDSEGRWIEANESMLHICELDQIPVGLTSQQVAKISPTYMRAIDKCAQTDQYVREHGKEIHYEDTIEWTDGSEKIFEIVKVPIHYDQDETVHILMISRDITERKKVEEELRMTKDQLESFINNTADAIVFYDLNGHFIKVNKAFEEMYGWTNEEIEDKQQTIVTIPKELMSEANEIGARIRAGEQVSGVETLRKKKDGTMFHVSMSFAPVRDRKGKIIALSGIIRDISERKKAEELLRKSEMLSVVGQLAAGVAHEIRNPLTSLKGFIQLTQSENRMKQKYVDIILAELDRINTIVNEFMVLAKPQACSFQKHDIYRILQDVITLIDTQAIIHNVEILTIYESKIPKIMCEENQIKQVMINLLKNAIEAMQSGGKILIKIAQNDEKHISISVIDQGTGIPQERIPKLGEPFYTTKEKGTGLGLMISYKIIRSHQGDIQVYSELDRGTTVQITLPIEQESTHAE